MVDKETIEAIEAELAYWEKKAEETREPLYRHIATGVKMSIDAIKRHELSQAIKLHSELRWVTVPNKLSRFEGKLYE